VTKRPTQTDVANLAGVSRTTVSYVLNKRSGGNIRITERTRQKVLQAAEELGYEPNAAARNLRSGLSRVIGLLVPDTQNPHYLDLLAGVEDAVVDQDYYLMLVSANLDPERERRCLRSLLQQRLDGLILTPTYPGVFESEIASRVQRYPPIVFVSPQEGYDCVCADFLGGAGAMMDHLISLGHRRIGLIKGVAQPDLAPYRVEAYLDGISRFGPVDERLVVHCGHLMEDGYQATRDLLALEPPPTAIWSINDVLAVGALRAIAEQGLCVPDDISLAGFDDIPLASQLHPSLTTVRLEARELGHRAVETLLSRIEDPGHPPVRETLPTRLVVRQSTGAARMF
jgi:LacI family transcriptional regulator